MSDEWMQLNYLLEMELVQLQEEGLDTTGVADRIKQGNGQATQQQVESLLAQFDALPRKPGFDYQEPSDLQSIHALRPAGPRRLERPDDATVSDKLLGAWLGRAAGCQLGKPVEGLHRSQIETYLKAADAYPLADYMPFLNPPPDGIRLHESARAATKGNFSEMARDDDIDYTILGVHILEQYGPHFTTENVAETWLAYLPYHMVYTAERVAYRNLVNQLSLERVPVWLNPYREWIGAQIRADGWAYAAATWPEKAAEFAWRDASVSHVKNGIYGEMWVAAMIAAAFAQPSGQPTLEQIKEIINIGLSEIPADCRLAESVRDLLQWHEELDTWEAAWERINDRYGHYHWVHTINNALLVGLGLLYGAGDYSQSICIAVMGGWDTDCNGATVGSILGAVMGAKALPSAWTDPLNDRTRSAVIGFDNSRFSDLAQRSLVLNKQITGA
jgi:ADP-ribosylglycohydrolase